MWKARSIGIIGTGEDQGKGMEIYGTIYPLKDVLKTALGGQRMEDKDAGGKTNKGSCVPSAIKASG